MERRTICNAEIVRRWPLPHPHPPSIVAIPARNEADRIARCLTTLAVQRDQYGAAVSPGAFAVLVLVNNTTDDTARIAQELAPGLPFPLEVLEVHLLSGATAGGARRRAMQEARERFRGRADDGILLTTDADSVVTPTWFASTLLHFAEGVDCVAGYIDAEAGEIFSHGPAFLERGRLEDTYLRLIAEIYARCDNRPHNPWPNHRVSSGASLAVTLAAYDAVGGMPDLALGEDGAFTATLDAAGFEVRHALDVSVVTSCRLDGRAVGGAADTMRYRRETPDAPCDADLEPAAATLRRAAYRGYLRKAFQKGNARMAAERLLPGFNFEFASGLGFASLWQEVEARHPKLQRGAALRPSQLAREIAAATFILRHLRKETPGVREDRSPHATASAPVGG